MRLYRTLLHAYPASFRAEYGEEMCAVFKRRMQEAPAAMRPLLWLEALGDTLWNALGAHADILRQDLRYTARTLRRSAGFAFTAVTVAALGIGATTAAFTLVDHVLIRPLPFAHPERLVKLYEDHSAAGAGRTARDWDMSPANYRDWKNLSTSFEGMGAYRGLLVNLVGAGEPLSVGGASVTAEMFPLLGVPPAIGRIFAAKDDREGAPGTVILSYGFWQREFGGDPTILGRKVLMDDAPYTVIGVMPKGFYFPTRDANLWTAMRFGPAHFEDRTDTYIYGIARLKAGVPVESASAEVRTIAAQLARAYPKELARVSATVIRLRDDISVGSRRALMVLLAAALCVLLVACTNLANLLLARAMMRRKDLAVRAAIGAGRERLVRQMLTESLLLAVAGGAAGVALAVVALPLLARLVPVYLPISECPAIDYRVLLSALILTLATGVGFGAFPPLQVSRAGDGLRENSRAGGGRRQRLRSVLVVAQVTGSLVLLVCCGLLMRALWRIQAVNPGFRPDNVLTLRTSLPMPKYERPAARQQFYERVLDQTRQLAGVTGAAYTSFLPIIHGGGIWPVEVEGDEQNLSARQTASMRFVTPGFFRVMGIPQLSGRDVSEADTLDTQLVALVSVSFVRRYWPGQNPVGHRFNFGNADRQVIGVVGDVRVRGLERSSEPQVYMPYRQLGPGISTWYAPKDLAVRAANPAALAPALRRIIHEADPELPVSRVRLLSDIVEADTSPRRVQVTVLTSFALIAFLLAAVGVHGLLSFAVTHRTQEIGVRMALGASRTAILGMVVREGAALAGVGIALGVTLAYGAARALQSLLAGVQPGDVPTFAAAIALCLCMTLAGCLLPALRAARTDPTTAIRAE